MTALWGVLPVVWLVVALPLALLLGLAIGKCSYAREAPGVDAKMDKDIQS